MINTFVHGINVFEPPRIVLRVRILTNTMNKRMIELLYISDMGVNI